MKELCRETFGDLVPLAIGESERVKKKPAPDTVIEAAAGIGVPLKDCVYVGDSEVDLATAETPGFRVFLSPGGFVIRNCWKVWEQRRSLTRCQN